MSRRHHLHAIGGLAKALHHSDSEVEAHTEAGLPPNAPPRLTFVDGELLGQEQRECLYGVLQVGNMNGKSDLLVAVLNALEVIRDVNALTYVEALASRPVDSSSVRRVKTAAENCLQTLSEIRAVGDPHESLLRPSEAALGTTDTLLRPFMGDTGSPETLVRPVSRQPDDIHDECLCPDWPMNHGRTIANRDR